MHPPLPSLCAYLYALGPEKNPVFFRLVVYLDVFCVLCLQKAILGWLWSGAPRGGGGSNVVALVIGVVPEVSTNLTMDVQLTCCFRETVQGTSFMRMHGGV